MTEDEYISRSRKKRESTADQKLGEKLAALPISILQASGISADLLQAFAELPKMRSHEARRRQFQFIGRLMRAEDREVLQKLRELEL